jgi:hypothetical protein
VTAIKRNKGWIEVDMNITMRYVMVQAQREAAGGHVCVEHLYLAILSLGEKNVKDIARTPAQEESVRGDLEALRSFIADEKIDVWPTCHWLREALAGRLPSEYVPEPDENIPGFLGRAGKRCAGAGREQITVGDVIVANDRAPSPLIALCLIDTEFSETPKEQASARGREIIRERLGLFDPVLAMEVTVTDAGALPPVAETVLSQDISITREKPVPQPKAPAPSKTPVPPPEPAHQAEARQKAAPANTPAPPADGVVFFDIPAPGAAARGIEAAPPEAIEAAPPEAKKGEGEQPKVKPPRRSTPIAGLTFRGGTAVAAAQYFAWVILAPTALLFILMRIDEVLSFSGNPWFYATFGIGIFVWLALILKGVTSLIGRRMKAFEIFANTAINLFLGVIAASILSDTVGLGKPVFVKSLVVIYAFILDIAALVRVKRLRKLSGQKGMELSTAMLKLRGAPSAIFFEYLLRSFLLSGLVFAVVWIGDLQVNEFWKAAFVICAFLWAFETIRVLLLSWKMIYDEASPVPVYRGFKLNAFLIVQHFSLGLPAFGMYLMWYFQWFPMRTWLIVLYGLYGFLWLWLTLGLLFALSRKGAKP